LKSIKKDVKNIFMADKYIEKGQKRTSYINELKKKDLASNNTNNNIYDFQFFKTRQKLGDMMENFLYSLEEEIKKYKEKNYLNKLKFENFFKKIKKKIFSFTGLWSNKTIFFLESNENLDENENDNLNNSFDAYINEALNKNRYALKYKLMNHYGNILYRPILSPIYDINSYLPCFSRFNKDNLFIEKKEGNPINTVINLNLNDIFAKEDNSFSYLNTPENENTDSTISMIYNNIFNELYKNYNNKIYPNLVDDKLISSSLSGLKLNSFSCCYVTQMSHVKGYFNIDKTYCLFFQNIYQDDEESKLSEDYDKDKKMCYGSYLKLNNNKYSYIKIKYNHIKYIFLRKYYFKDSALEIFTTKNKVYYFNFTDESKRQSILSLILNKLTTKKEIKILKNKIVGYISTSSSNNNYIINNNADFLSGLVDQWQEWKISTMEFLLWLNILSNRSFNDISQYPVFPWILTQYKDNFIPEKKKSVLSKSFMPNMFKFQSKKISSHIIKSNSGDIESKNNNYSKTLSGVDDIIGGMESSIVESNNNNNSLVNNINIAYYDQFNVEDKETKINLDTDIRNFTLPMGMFDLTEKGEKRKKNYLEKYNMMKKELESNETDKKISSNINKIYIYGSHYSNPLYVCHYLTRVFPFCNISIELQGDKFDDPNRLLISVDKSFEAASSHEGDIRELCPEFYYLPQIFSNLNNLDLKIDKQSEDKSNEVLLPKWADNNNYIFISKLRTFLESEIINKKINQWFDLIFGYKQKGKDAEVSFNLFLPSSYDNFDIQKEAQTPDQKQYFLRLTEFGLTPHQILSKKFAKKKDKDNKKKTICESWIEKDLIINQFQNKKVDKMNELKVLKIKFVDDENIMIILNNYQFIKYEIVQFQYISEKNIQFESKAKNYVKADKIAELNFFKVSDNKIINRAPPIIIYDKGSFIAQAGFTDGRIIITQLNSKNKSKSSNNSESCIIISFEVYNSMDLSPIVALIIDNNEEYIFAGSILGSVTIYRNKKEQWKKKWQINDHLNMSITSLFYNDNLNIWGSSSYDGFVNIYTFPSNKKISSIKVENDCLYADNIFISSSPLPSIILYCQKNKFFYTYSVIGKLIFKESENNPEIFSPLIIKASNFGEILVYCVSKGKINWRYLPSLNLFLSKKIDLHFDLNFDIL
jgi:hypothetical protein